MTLSDYINSIEFDSFETYKYNHFYDTFASSTYSDTKFFLKSNLKEVPNSIVHSDYSLNPSSKLVYKTNSLDIINNFKRIVNEKYTGKITQSTSITYTDAVIFRKKDCIVGGFDISFVNSSLKTFQNNTLEVPEEVWTDFTNFFHNSLSHTVVRYSVIANPDNQEWRRYRAPDSFYFNQKYGNYEASFTFPVFGSEPFKLTIETEGRFLTKEIIDRVTLLRRYEYDFASCRKLKEYIFDLYKEMQADFSLPTLKDEDEQIYLDRFVKMTGINVPKQTDGDIMLCFKNWDEEHGLYLYINPEKGTIEVAY